jgi:hypothetical protein
VTQVVEHLASKYEGLSSNPSIAKKKEKEKKKANKVKAGYSGSYCNSSYL